MDDCGFCLVDFSLAVDRRSIRTGLRCDVVSIAEPAPGLSLAHPSLQAAPRLLRKILEIESVHGSLQANMQFGDIAFCQGNQLDAGKAELFEDGGHMLQVS